MTATLQRGELCVSRKKQKSEILHCVQNDNTRLFCHSEEQGDEDVIFFLSLAPQG